MVAFTQTKKPNMPTTAKSAFNRVRAGNRSNQVKKPKMPGQIPGKLPGPRPQPTGALGQPQQDFRNTLQSSLQSDVTRDVNAPDAYTQAQLGMLDESSQRARQQQVEDLKRYGVLSSGNTADVLGTFDVGTQRTRQNIIGEGFNRALAERRAGLSQGLLLSDSDTAASQAQAALSENIAARRGNQGLQQQQITNQNSQFGLGQTLDRERMAQDVSEAGLDRGQQTALQTAQFGENAASDTRAAQESLLSRQAQTARDTAAFGQQTALQTAQFGENATADQRAAAEALLARQAQTARDTAAFGQQTALQTADLGDSASSRQEAARQFNAQNLLNRDVAEADIGIRQGAQTQQGTQFDQTIAEQIAAREAQQGIAQQAQNFNERATMAGLTGTVGGGPVDAGALGVEGIIRDFRAREGSAAPGEREAAYGQVAQRFTEQTGRVPTEAEVNDLFGFRTVNPGTVQTLAAQQLAQQATEAAAERQLRETLQSGQITSAEGMQQTGIDAQSRQAALDRGFTRTEAEAARGFQGGQAALDRGQDIRLLDRQQEFAGSQNAFDRGQQVRLQTNQFGENQLGRDEASRQAALDRGFTRTESQAQRDFLGGESQSERERLINDATANRQLEMGRMELQGSQFDRSLDEAGRQAALDRGFTRTEAEAQRDFLGGESQAERQRLINDSTANRQLEMGRMELQGSQFDRDLTERAAGRTQQGSQFDTEQQRLITDATKNRELEIQRILESQRQFDAQDQLAQAGLTGQYGDQQTLAAKQLAQQDELARAGLTGQLGDQQTLAAQQLAQQGGQFDRTIDEQIAARTGQQDLAQRQLNQQGDQFDAQQRLAREDLYGGSQGISAASNPAVKRLVDTINGNGSFDQKQQAVSELGQIVERDAGRSLSEQEISELLTGGEIAGRQTLSAQQAGFQNDLAEGQLTGQYNNEDTLAAQQLAQQDTQFGASQDLARQQAIGSIKFGDDNWKDTIQQKQLDQQQQQFATADQLARQEAMGQVKYGDRWYDTLSREGVEADIAAQRAGLTGQFEGQDTLQAGQVGRQNDLEAMSINLALQESNLPISSRRAMEDRLREITGMDFSRQQAGRNPQQMTQDELIDELMRLRGQ